MSIRGDPEEPPRSRCHIRGRAGSVPGPGGQHAPAAWTPALKQSAAPQGGQAHGRVAHVGHLVGEAPVEGVDQEGLQEEVVVEGRLRCRSSGAGTGQGRPSRRRRQNQEPTNKGPYASTGRGGLGRAAGSVASVGRPATGLVAWTWGRLASVGWPRGGDTEGTQKREAGCVGTCRLFARLFIVPVRVGDKGDSQMGLRKSGGSGGPESC